MPSTRPTDRKLPGCVCCRHRGQRAIKRSVAVGRGDGNVAAAAGFWVDWLQAAVPTTANNAIAQARIACHVSRERPLRHGDRSTTLANDAQPTHSSASLHFRRF